MIYFINNKMLFSALFDGFTMSYGLNRSRSWVRFSI